MTRSLAVALFALFLLTACGSQTITTESSSDNPKDVSGQPSVTGGDAVDEADVADGNPGGDAVDEADVADENPGGDAVDEADVADDNPGGDAVDEPDAVVDNPVGNGSLTTVDLGEDLPAAAFAEWQEQTANSDGCVAESGDPDDKSKVTVSSSDAYLCDGMKIDRLGGDEITNLIDELGCPSAGDPPDCPYTAVAAFNVNNGGAGLNVDVQIDFSPGNNRGTYECQALSLGLPGDGGCNNKVSGREDDDEYQLYRVDTGQAGGGQWISAGTAEMNFDPEDEVIAGTVTHLSTIVIVRLPEAQPFAEFAGAEGFSDGEPFELPARPIHIRSDGTRTVELPFTETAEGWRVDPDGERDLIATFPNETAIGNGDSAGVLVREGDIEIGELSLAVSNVDVHGP